MKPSHPKVEELHLSDRVTDSCGDWASQPRAVYSGHVMDQELRKLFPVEVGLQALRERKKQREVAMEWRDRSVGCWEFSDAQVSCFYIHVSSCGLDSVYQIDVAVGNKMVTLEKVTSLHTRLNMAKKKAIRAVGAWRRPFIGDVTVASLLKLCEELVDDQLPMPDLAWIKLANGSYNVLWEYGWVRAIVLAYLEQADWWEKRGHSFPKQKLDKLLAILR